MAYNSDKAPITHTEQRKGAIVKLINSFVTYARRHKQDN